MSLSFELPIGAPADVAELEYIAALQQTSKHCNESAILTIQDIRYYLVSRHGVKRPLPYLQDLILCQLAGSPLPEEPIRGKNSSVLTHQASTGSSSRRNEAPLKQQPTEIEDTTIEGNTTIAHHSLALPQETAQVATTATTIATGAICEDVVFANQLETSTKNKCNNSDETSTSALPSEVPSPTTAELSYLEESDEDEEIVESNDGGDRAANNVISPCDSNSISAAVRSPLTGVPDGDGETSKNQQNGTKAECDFPSPSRPSPLSALRKYATRSGESWGSTLMNPEATPVMDLTQLLALLYIPELLRASRTNRTTRSKGIIDAATSSDDHETHEKKPPDHIVAAVLFDAFLMILCKTCHLEPGIELTRSVLRSIGEKSGEEWSDVVLDEMLQACRTVAKGDENDSEASTEIPILNGETLMRALTHDIQAYPLEREGIASTHYEDALSRSTSCKAKAEFQEDGDDQEKSNESGDSLHRTVTLANLDYTADTYRSSWWAGLAWVTLVVTFVAYLFNGFSIDSRFSKVECATDLRSQFGCEIINGIITWLEIFSKLTLLGAPFVYFSTLGNSVYALDNEWSNLAASFLGIACVVLFTIVAYAEEVSNVFFSTEKEEGMGVAYFTSLILGCLLLLTQIGNAVKLLLPIHVREARWFKPFASGNVRMERWLKVSATHKAQKVLANALFCHIPNNSEIVDTIKTPVVDWNAMREDEDEDDNPEYEIPQAALPMASAILETNHWETSEALLRFQEQRDETVRIGGVWWTMKCARNRSLQKQEGIWFSPRLVSSNLIQWFVFMLLPILWAGVASAISVSTELSGNVTKLEAQFGVVVGFIGALIAAVYIAGAYIPSSVSTTLMFRSGVLGSLKDKDFGMYRVAEDTRTTLFGASFWGMTITVAIAWVVVGGIAFFCVWGYAREVTLLIAAQMIGIGITMAIKQLVLIVLRARWYKGFFRRQPAGANILTTVLECWNLGLSTGYILVRAAKILFISIMYIGRVDTPFLAKHVNDMYFFQLDGFPIAFRKDLLIHEAHRHPFIERLGLLYLIKLRLGRQFGMRAGAAWRILFVVTIMPWMRRYRQATSSYLQKARLNQPNNTEAPTTSNPYEATASSSSSLALRNVELEREVALLRQQNERLRATLDGGDWTRQRLTKYLPGESLRNILE